MRSSTVLLTRLAEHHEQRWLNILLERTVSYLESGNPYDEPDEELENYEMSCDNSLVVHGTPGSILAKFNHEDHASKFVGDWNGVYFKCRTIYAEKVPDEQIGEPLKARAVDKS